MKLRNLLVLGSMAVMGAAFMSCSKDVAFDSEGLAKEAAKKARSEFEVNFVKKYGAVDPNKSWDLSSMQPKYSFTSGEKSARALTRTAESISQTTTPGFKVEGDILDWCFRELPAGRNNFLKGDPFYMTVVAGEPLTIVPIFQGNASKYWQLWMHVDGIEDDILIWGKGEKLGYRMNEGDELTLAGTGQSGIARDAFEVEAPAVTFGGLPVKNDVYFYLKTWTNYSEYEGDKLGNKATVYSSLKEKMLALNNCEKPKNVPAGQNVCIIGCEDATDNDYEDLVFLVYGKFSINEPEEVFATITKRYMVEDLGSTDDFDFNDIVVDVSQTEKTTYYYEIDPEKGEKTLANTEGPVVVSQEAVVRAAGGILDFTINIGSSSWTKSEHLTPFDQMMNTGIGSAIDYNAVLDQFNIENKDWNPESNNISITVDGRGGNAGVQVIPFPKEGEIPMIIAVDPTWNWMSERQSVPADWFTTK